MSFGPNAAALAAAIVLMAGCDPCIGSTLCEEPRLSYAGRVAADSSGAGVPGAEVVVTRTSGVGITPNRIALRTDSGGIFVLRARADRAGEVVAELSISTSAIGGGLLRVEGLRLRTTAGKGDVLWLGEWRLPAPPATLPSGPAGRHGE